VDERDARAPGGARRKGLSACVVGLAVLAAGVGCSSARSAALGFWFEEVTYRSSRLGGALTSDELKVVVRIARTEIADAFAGLRVTVTERRDTRYRVRVMQQLSDPRFRGDVGVAGASRAISMFAGDGAVNFSMLAAYADSYAPPDVDRAGIVAAIGRGVGRAAVHEFVHQLLGSGEFEATKDPSTYEYGSAARKEQYYGPMHWGPARPLLEGRFGTVPPP
jgi:hypothetical protein